MLDDVSFFFQAEDGIRDSPMTGVQTCALPICSGKITEILYKPGKFLNASLDKASEDNERNYYKISNSSGEEIIVVQIAGLIARRIVCEVKENDELNQGDRIGMIRFGSRADIYFENYNPLVKVNQKTIAGETILAKK